MTYTLKIIGILFAAAMIYLTFLNFKRRSYGKKSFVLWLLVWLFFMFMVTFPETAYGIMSGLGIQRTVDFFVMGGLLFFSVMIFYMYISVKRIEKKVEGIVRRDAIMSHEKKASK